MGARYTTSLVITCIARTCDGCWCAPRETPNPARRKRPSTVVHSKLSWNKNYVSMLTVTLKYVGEGIRMHISPNYDIWSRGVGDYV